jgi:hypothetical protein
VILFYSQKQQNKGSTKVLLFSFAALCKVQGFKANNHSITSRSSVIHLIEQKEIKLEVLFNL